MNLQQLAQSIPDLVGWSHAEKIKLFGWYLHTSQDKERFNQADARACYDELHLEKPGNVGSYFDQLTKRKPKQFSKMVEVTIYQSL